MRITLIVSCIFLVGCTSTAEVRKSAANTPSLVERLERHSLPDGVKVECDQRPRVRLNGRLSFPELARSRVEQITESVAQECNAPEKLPIRLVEFYQGDTLMEVVENDGNYDVHFCE